jgi:hypothetical protein
MEETSPSRTRLRPHRNTAADLDLCTREGRGIEGGGTPEDFQRKITSDAIAF